MFVFYKKSSHLTRVEGEYCKELSDDQKDRNIDSWCNQ